MRIEADTKLDFKDVLIRPKRSTLNSRALVDISRTFRTRHAGREITGIPVIAANMDTTGTIAMAQALARHGMFTALHKHIPVDELVGAFGSEDDAEAVAFQQHVFVTTGTSEADLDRLHGILDRLGNRCSNICLDVANGYTEVFVETVGRLRDRYPNHVLMAGNVVTGEMVEELVLSGADIVKIGIGPGSVCTTRRMTGVGYPQLSAVIECADAAHGLKGLVCADGGCQVPGDLAKAFGGGADFVMLGGMLAGHVESGGEVVEVDGVEKMRFYGMSSEEAMLRYSGEVAKYRASEGKSVLIDFRGPVDQSVQEILGGLRSACTYVGAQTLKELSKRTTFVQVSQQLNPMFGG